MESTAPSSHYTAQNSKKRVFPGDVEVLETAQSSKMNSKPMSSKQKEVVCEMKDVDTENDCGDVMTIDEKVDRKGKGKLEEISSTAPVDLNNLSNDGSGSDDQMSENVDVDDPESDLYSEEDEWIDTYYDDITCDDSSVFDSHLDYIDLPPGVEVSFPWLQNKTHNSSTSSNGGNLDLDLESSWSAKLKNEMKDMITSEKDLKEASMLIKEPGVGSGVPKLHYSPLNISEPSGFVNGSAIGPLAQDSANDRNGEPLPKAPAPMGLTEIFQSFDLFKKFDTVEDCSDHYYANKGSSSKQPPKNWAKRIQEEWKILETNLPDAIFVRAYESRMDLLRAVIIGAQGTPYHDGLFFFDVFFPDSYPSGPPLVHYHSGGLRINPNLYNCGKVCLSLLNTWSGGKKEMWTPGVSTMLQVLVSIQGLILNAKPYFNEPGWAPWSGTKEGEKSSLDYNETTFIYNLQTMVYTMRRPPKHFEAFVAGYFCKHARDILVSCKAYMEGAQVGCRVKSGVQDVAEGGKSCSDNFKVSLGGYITTLINTFTQIRASDCQEFLSLAQIEVKGSGLQLRR